MSTDFAVGKIALGLCDRCGRQYLLKELTDEVVDSEESNIRVCSDCWDEDHPQYQLGKTPIYDPQALRDPRPDPRTDVTTNTQLLGYTAIGAPIFSTPGVGTNYLDLPGTAGAFATTPHSAQNTFVDGVLDVSCVMAPDTWQDAVRSEVYVGKDALFPSRSWAMYQSLTTPGFLNFFYSPDGTEAVIASSTATVPFADGAVGGVRFKFSTVTGDVVFYVSFDEGASWAQLGATVSITPGSVFDSAMALCVGGDPYSGLINTAGKLYTMQMYIGDRDTDGTLVASFDATRALLNESSYAPAPITATTGEVYQILGGASIQGNYYG